MFVNVLKCVTLYLLVFRYIAVCFPFFRLRHNIKARFYIVPILLFAPLYNVPRFFEFDTVKNVTFTCLDDQLNSWNGNKTSLPINETMSPKLDVQKLQNNTNLSNIFLSKEYFVNTMNTKDINKRSLDKIEYLGKEEAYNDQLVADQIGKMHFKSMLLYRTGHQGIRIKRSNRKQFDDV